MHRVDIGVQEFRSRVEGWDLDGAILLDEFDELVHRLMHKHLLHQAVLHCYLRLLLARDN